MAGTTKVSRKSKILLCIKQQHENSYYNHFFLDTGHQTEIKRMASKEIKHVTPDSRDPMQTTAKFAVLT